MSTKSEVKKLFLTFLHPAGFEQDGNYFIRKSGDALQALYLQPSRQGTHAYFPEMLLTYSDLSECRRNTQLDCHLSARLSDYYHPDGDPRSVPRQEWMVWYDDKSIDGEAQRSEIEASLNCFFDWLAEFPTWQVATEKMKDAKYAIWVGRHNLFGDLGQQVPVPMSG